MILPHKLFALLVYLLILSLFVWSFSFSQVRDETAPKESGSPLVFVGVLLAVLLVVVLIMPGDSPDQDQKVQDIPAKADVPPIRNMQLKVDFKMEFTYTPKQEDSVRVLSIPYLLERLNSIGQSDGNSFTIPDGEATNFILTYTINQVGQIGNDRYTGSMTLSGWGWGTICTISSGEYPFTNPFHMLNKLTDQAYSWIHNGWRETQTNR
ncbi:MAG: hypothetical protein V1799_05180 [bacterium]